MVGGRGGSGGGGTSSIGNLPLDRSGGSLCALSAPAPHISDPHFVSQGGQGGQPRVVHEAAGTKQCYAERLL